MRRTTNSAGQKSISIGSPMRTGRAQVGAGDQLINVMLVIVVATAIGFIGTDVNAEVNDSISVSSGSDFANAQSNLSQGYSDAMGLSDIVFIVLMFSVILGVLLVFRVRTT